MSFSFTHTHTHTYTYIYDPFIIFMQVTQQVFVADEWVRNAHNEVRAEAHSHLEVEKALEAHKEKHAELANKLVEADRARASAVASLKTAKKQAKDQRQKLHITEIELATQKQLVLELRSNL